MSSERERERSRALSRDLERAIDGPLEELDAAMDAALERAMRGEELDLSHAPADVADTLVTRLAERSGFLRHDVRAGMLAGLWRWGLTSSASPQTKRLLLCAILDEDGLPDGIRREAAIVLSVMGDKTSLAALAARMHLACIPLDVALGALLAIDPVEAFEELHERYRQEEQTRATIARFLDRRADPRWIDEALAVASFDPSTAMSTLRAIGSPRALEELGQLAVPSRDEP